MKASSAVLHHSSLRVALICLGAAFAALLVLPGGSSVHACLAGQLACLGLPIWYRWQQRRLDYFEPIHLISLIQVVFFGLGAMWIMDNPHLGYDLYIVPYVPRAAFYCLLGHAALVLSYFLSESKAAAPPADERPRDGTFVVLLALVGFVGFVATAMVEASFLTASKIQVMLSPIAQLSPLFLYAWCLGWVVFYSGRARWIDRVVLLCALIPMALGVAYLTVSDKSLIMTILGVPIMARWYGIRRLPWMALVVLLLLLIFVVFPVYNMFRSSDVHLDTTTRLEDTYHMLTRSGRTSYAERAVDQFKFRMALINSVAVIVRDVGRWVPFAWGNTLRPMATSFIPRYIWRDKPIYEPGREFGRLFRVTNIQTRDTHIATTLPGELYWNFHVPGVILGMGLCGFAVQRLFRRYCVDAQRGPTLLATHLLLLIDYAHWGGAISIDLMSTLRTLLLLAAARWVARRAGLLVSTPIEARA